MTSDNTLFDGSSGVIATVAGIVVGSFIKLTSKLLDSDKDKLEEHVILRRELREELDVVKEELQLLRNALDDWKQKYYSQVELTNSLKMDVTRLTDELAEYKQISGLFPTQEL